MSETSNVETIVGDFTKIEVSDLRTGIECYSQTERQIDALKGGVAAWLFNVAHYVWIEEDCLPEETLKSFTKKLEDEVEYITSPIAGGNQLQKSQAKLTGRNSLASAYKKIKNGLEKGLDLNDYPSCSALAEESAKRNKEEKAAEKLAKTQSQIPDAAAKVLKAQGVDVETEAGAKMLADKIKEMTKKVMEAQSVDGDKAGTPKEENIADAPYAFLSHSIPQDMYAQTDRILKAVEDMTNDLIFLLLEKTNIMNGDTFEQKANAACEQVLQGMEAKRKTWHEQALGHHTQALKAGFIVEDVAVNS